MNRTSSRSWIQKLSRLASTPPRTPPLDARLRGHDRGGSLGRHSRESGNPGFRADRGFRRASRLSLAEWGLLLEAGVWLAVARLMLLTVPLKRMAPFLARPMSESAPAVDAVTQQRAQRLGWAVRTMSRYTPWHSLCLAQALAVKRMLWRRGIASTLYLGLTKDEANGLQAHAWVRCGSVVLTGGQQNLEIYTVVATFAEKE